MHGDDRTRRCDRCSLNVHNISAMTSEEAEAFLASYLTPSADGTTPRLCGHLHLRADGTVITADCPVGLAAARARAHRALARVAAVVGLTAAVSWVAARQSSVSFAHAQPLNTIATWLQGKPVQTPVQALVDGMIILPRSQPPLSGGGQ